MEIPTIDVAPVREGRDATALGAAIDDACRTVGFFRLEGHGIPVDLLRRLETAAQAFFALPDREKAAVAMEHGGRAWRGWFPVGGELTSGVPDHKEGLYLGTELGSDDPRVRAGTPLHGPNLFPERPAALRPAVLEYLDAVTALGQAVLVGMAVGLGLPADWFQQHLTAEPLVLLRLFHYPPLAPAERTTAEATTSWSVGEHTDYGLITLLHTDETGGLEVRGPDGWIEVPPVPDGFVVNLGDMLERMTGGRWRSTPHRVRNTSDRDRLSVPLFLDPGWDVTVPVLPLGDRAPSGTGAGDRWDGADVRAWEGTYGSYVRTKVARVFPELGDAVL